MKPATKAFVLTVGQLLLAALGAWLANKAQQQNVPINPQESKHATP